MEQKYNMKSPAVKRLMREAIELRDSTDEYYAQPIEDNLFEWHFTFRGPPDSDFDGGIFHGRILLPPDYPMKPPSIILLTPNGRFETNKKICLSISGHHPESWQPSWSIRTALLAIIGFMPTQGLGAIGALDYTVEERKALAQRSHSWQCPTCGSIGHQLQSTGPNPRKVNEEARELAAQITFKGEEPTTTPQPNETKPEEETPAVGSPELASNGPTTSNNLSSVTNVQQSDDNSVVRRRLPPQQDAIPNRTTVNSSSGINGATRIIIALLVTAIALLMVRRIFFML